MDGGSPGLAWRVVALAQAWVGVGVQAGFVLGRVEGGRGTALAVTCYSRVLMQTP